MRIAFIGFGEAGQAFAASLRAKGTAPVAAFDILAGTPAGAAIGAAAGRLGVALAGDAPAAARTAGWLFSAVTAANGLEATRAAAPGLGPGQVFFDLNSASAARKRAAAEVVRARGASYVDMAVMAPVHPRGHATPVLLAGDLHGLPPALRELGFDLEDLGAEVGAAATVKLVRSLFVKGLEAVTVQALLAARAAGCLDRVAGSLAASYPGLDWPEFAHYQIERVARHGVRRAEEMRESARTIDELGFPEGAALAEAIAGLQDAVGGLGRRPEGDLDASLAALDGRRRQTRVRPPDGS